MKQLPIVLGAVWVFLALIVGIVVVTWPQPQIVMPSEPDTVVFVGTNNRAQAVSDDANTAQSHVSIANTPGSEGEDAAKAKVKILPK
ncbi:MAG TPA: hypothetical protein VJB41_02135 [Patescibacteria group bacterium]|nr:hypothetical protein [Patescibacteria group bacterium]